MIFVTRHMTVYNCFYLKVETLDDEGRYSHLVTGLLDDHQHVVTNLAEGFQQCQNHISVSVVLALKCLNPTLPVCKYGNSRGWGVKSQTLPMRGWREACKSHNREQ